MNAPVSVPLGEFNDCILASQYNDMVKRRSRILEGEPRLLWAVLEEAIRSYLSNMKCLTANQCSEFEEVRHWFCPPQGEPRGLFAFRTICDLLEIDGDRLVKRLKSLRVSDLPMRRGRIVSRNPKSQPLAA